MIDQSADDKIQRYGANYVHHQYVKIYSSLVNLPAFNDHKLKMMIKILDKIDCANLEQKIYFGWVLSIDDKFDKFS